MMCPHCAVGIHEGWSSTFLGTDIDGVHGVQWMKCSECDRFIVRFRSGTPAHVGGLESGPIPIDIDEELSVYVVHPYGGSRPVSSDVPSDLAKDFGEAAAVLPLSPSASAALSRRCMQNAIRQATGITKATLYAEIEEVIAQKLVPSWLADQLHDVRRIGNFAAHPTKDSNTGTIMEVEPGEAEWNLAIVEGLFDHFYVEPARAARRQAQLNKKLGP